MTIAAERDLAVRTAAADPFDPIAVYAAGVEAGLESALWLRASDDLALVGLGRAWAVEADGDGRFATADAAWRALIRRFGPDDPSWPSGVGPRVAEPALMLIDPYPWSAPLEDVRLKKN